MFEKIFILFIFLSSSLLYSINEDEEIEEKYKKLPTNGCFNLVKKIGSGLFSPVFLGRNTCSSQELQKDFAVKYYIWENSYWPSYEHWRDRLDYRLYFRDAKDYRDFVNKKKSYIECFHSEVEALKKLKGHPNIVHMYDYGVSVGTADPPYIVLELADLDLYAVICKMKENNLPLTEGNARFIVSEIESAARCIHDVGIRHVELKLENLLYFLEERKLKVADFNGNIEFQKDNGIFPRLMRKALDAIQTAKILLDHECKKHSISGCKSECDIARFGVCLDDLKRQFPLPENENIYNFLTSFFHTKCNPDYLDLEQTKSRHSQSRSVSEKSPIGYRLEPLLIQSNEYSVSSEEDLFTDASETKKLLEE